MLSTVSKLTPLQLEVLNRILERIVSKIKPDKIYCFGWRESAHRWSCFDALTKESIKTEFVCDLLIVSQSAAGPDIQQLAEQQSEGGITVHVLVESVKKMNQVLKESGRFFTTIYHHSILLFDGTCRPLEVPPPLDAAVLKERTINSWQSSFAKADKFFKTATYCLCEKWPEQALFLAHQAMEHICIAVIRMMIGYRPVTHNLSRLLLITENFTEEMSSLFPQSTEEELRLFSLLMESYSGARYREDYVVKEADADVLLERVGQLLFKAQAIYEKKIT